MENLTCAVPGIRLTGPFLAIKYVAELFIISTLFALMRRERIEPDSCDPLCSTYIWTKNLRFPCGQKNGAKGGGN